MFVRRQGGVEIGRGSTNGSRVGRCSNMVAKIVNLAIDGSGKLYAVPSNLDTKLCLSKRELKLNTLFSAMAQGCLHFFPVDCFA